MHSRGWRDCADKGTHPRAERVRAFREVRRDLLSTRLPNRSCTRLQACTRLNATLGTRAIERMTRNDPGSYLKDVLTQQASEIGQLLTHQWMAA